MLPHTFLVIKPHTGARPAGPAEALPCSGRQSSERLSGRPIAPLVSAGSDPELLPDPPPLHPHTPFTWAHVCIHNDLHDTKSLSPHYGAAGNDRHNWPLANVAVPSH